ncbi:MAG: hypothetical protein QOJ40_2704 [Verrucomicrobiota bacterium]
MLRPSCAHVVMGSRKLSIKLSIAFALLAFRPIAFAYVSLGLGDSYVFNFTLPYVRPANADPPTINVYFSGGSAPFFEEKTEVFSSPVSVSPFFVDTYTFTPVPPNQSDARAFSWLPSSPPLWPSLQGAVRVTSLFGQFQLLRLYVQEDLDGGYYASWFDAVPVPEPSAIALIAVGMICCLRKIPFKCRVGEHD